MQFAKFKKVIKFDFFGKPYETTVIDEPQKDKAELWKGFREQFLNSVENTNQLNKLKSGSPTIIPSWTERELQKQFSNDEK